MLLLQLISHDLLFSVSVNVSGTLRSLRNSNGSDSDVVLTAKDSVVHSKSIMINAARRMSTPGIDK
mgnify:CR=1 FL=1